ncbi:hypothetical protein J6590_096267 [Homalodisca vitripennis]|nr:hypothetical protein J6590_031351 [Homalodisca vitripennis]KAG8334181.1 hypothetical protein J6590_096267 [Homalodisca vitripennis]
MYLKDDLAKTADTHQVPCAMIKSSIPVILRKPLERSALDNKANSLALTLPYTGLYNYLRGFARTILGKKLGFPRSSLIGQVNPPTGCYITKSDNTTEESKREDRITVADRSSCELMALGGSSRLLNIFPQNRVWPIGAIPVKEVRSVLVTISSVGTRRSILSKPDQTAEWRGESRPSLKSRVSSHEVTRTRGARGGDTRTMDKATFTHRVSGLYKGELIYSHHIAMGMSGPMSLTRLPEDGRRRELCLQY